MGDVDFNNLNLLLNYLGLTVRDADGDRVVSDRDTVSGKGLSELLFSQMPFDSQKPYQLGSLGLSDVKEMIHAFVPLSSALWKDPTANQDKREIAVLHLLRKRMESVVEGGAGRKERIQTTFFYWAAVKKVKLPPKALQDEIRYFEDMIQRHKHLPESVHQEIAKNADSSKGIVKDLLESLLKRTAH